jgi:hypothetical protein
VHTSETVEFGAVEQEQEETEAESLGEDNTCNVSEKMECVGRDGERERERKERGCVEGLWGCLGGL